MKVTVALGSNLGDRLAHLTAAVEGLQERSRLPLRISPVVETASVGGPEQPDFLNAVVVADLPEETDLWALADGLEQSRGRQRKEVHGPRTLDVDILDAGGVVSDDPRMTLPHPRAHLRAFVLLPWAAVDPEATLPGHGGVADLAGRLAASERQGVRARPDLTLAAGARG